MSAPKLHVPAAAYRPLRSNAFRAAASIKAAKPHTPDPLPQSLWWSLMPVCAVTVLAACGLAAQLHWSDSWFILQPKNARHDTVALWRAAYWCAATLWLTVVFDGLLRVARTLAGHDFSRVSAGPTDHDSGTSATATLIRVLPLAATAAVVAVSLKGGNESSNTPTHNQDMPALLVVAPQPAVSPPSVANADLSELVNLQKKLQAQWHDNVNQLLTHQKAQADESARHIQEAAQAVALAASQSSNLATATEHLAGHAAVVASSTHILSREVLPRVSNLVLSNSEEIRALNTSAVRSEGGTLSTPFNRWTILPDGRTCELVRTDVLGSRDSVQSFQCRSP